MTVEWSPDGQQLLVDQHSENAVHRWLWLVRAADASVRSLWHDERDTRMGTHWSSAWRGTARGFCSSPTSTAGTASYSLATAGGEPKRLTDGDWSVIGESNPSPLIVSPTRRVLLGTKNGEEQRQVYRLSEDGGAVTQVTTLPGTHFPYVAPDGRGSPSSGRMM